MAARPITPKVLAEWALAVFGLNGQAKFLRATDDLNNHQLAKTSYQRLKD